MGHFVKGLSDNFVGALERLVEQSAWWRDILADQNLLIAVRNEYINVYWEGQSIFKITFNGETVKASTHPKYLLNAALSEQIPFDPRTASFGELPSHALVKSYVGPGTLANLKTAAGMYSGDEKKGVHAIARTNDHVVDVEIAFDANGLPTVKNLPRIDLATIAEGPTGYELSFWEAKLFSNGDLRAQGDEVPVLDQIRQYRTVLQHYRDDVFRSYANVARNLVSIAEMSQGQRKVSPAIGAVANGAPLVMNEEPRVGLIIYGFDADQRDGAYWKVHKSKLEARLAKNALIIRGDAKGLKLP